MPRVEVGGDLCREVDGRAGFAQCGLQVAQEAVEDGVGDEHHQPEHQQGVGVKVEDVAGVPVGGQFVEALVFDAPAVVPELEDHAGGSQSAGHGCRPIPGRVDGRFQMFSGYRFVTGAGFVGVDDAQRGVDGLSDEAVGLAQPDLADGLSGPFGGGEGFGRQGRQQAAGLVEEFGLVLLDHGDEVFAGSKQHPNHRGAQVNRVAGEHVEATRMTVQHTCEQAHGGSHLVLAGQNRLEVEQEVKALADNLEEGEAVVVLDDLFAVDGQFSLQAFVVVALVYTAS